MPGPQMYAKSTLSGFFLKKKKKKKRKRERERESSSSSSNEIFARIDLHTLALECM